METRVLDSVLAQLRAAQAATRPDAAQNVTTGQVKAGSPGFSEALKTAIDSVNETQLKSGEMQKAFELGEEGTNLQDVMVQMAKANISFQTMIQVRNRMVSAYQDMMNMPV